MKCSRRDGVLAHALPPGIGMQATEYHLTRPQDVDRSAPFFQLGRFPWLMSIKMGFGEAHAQREISREILLSLCYPKPSDSLTV